MEDITNKEKRMDIESAKDTKPVMDQIIGLIHDIVPDLDTEITEATRLFEDLEFDSISTMQLLVAAEERFGFDSGDSEESLQAFETVGAFVLFVEKYKGSGSEIQGDHRA